MCVGKYATWLSVVNLPGLYAYSQRRLMGPSIQAAYCILPGRLGAPGDEMEPSITAICGRLQSLNPAVNGQ